MKWGPCHLLSSEGRLEGNLRSWKEFENSALRDETGRQRELRREAQWDPWWEVRQIPGFSTARGTPNSKVGYLYFEISFLTPEQVKL